MKNLFFSVSFYAVSYSTLSAGGLEAIPCSVQSDAMPGYELQTHVARDVESNTYGIRSNYLFLHASSSEVVVEGSEFSGQSGRLTIQYQSEPSKFYVGYLLPVFVGAVESPLVRTLLNMDFVRKHNPRTILEIDGDSEVLAYDPTNPLSVMMIGQLSKFEGQPQVLVYGASEDGVLEFKEVFNSEKIGDVLNELRKFSKEHEKNISGAGHCVSRTGEKHYPAN